MKIYTKTGDAGATGLIGGSRVSKADARIRVLGDLDEANAALGVCRATGLSQDVDQLLERVQSALFEAGAELAAPPGARGPHTTLDVRVTALLEASIDQWESQLQPLTQFILPGGCIAASQLHQARAICRRAERSLVAFAEIQPVGSAILAFVNRLSDGLFVMARLENARMGVPDVPWKRNQE